MQRKYVYASLERLDNLVFAYGVDQSDFVHGVKRLPANIVSLLGTDDNEHEVNAHTGLNTINDENEIRRYLLQSHSQPLKWMDYHEPTDLDFLTPSEIAELLYLGHMNRPIRTPFNYKLRNRYVFLEQKNGGVKMYYYYITAFEHVLNAAIVRHTLETYRGRFVFLRNVKVPTVPVTLIKQLTSLMSDGLFISFDQSSARQRKLVIPVFIEQADLDVEVFEPTRAERTALNTKQVAQLIFDPVKNHWQLTIDDQTAFAE